MNYFAKINVTHVSLCVTKIDQFPKKYKISIEKMILKLFHLMTTSEIIEHSASCRYIKSIPTTQNQTKQKVFRKSFQEQASQQKKGQSSRSCHLVLRLLPFYTAKFLVPSVRVTKRARGGVTADLWLKMQNKKIFARTGANTGQE